MIRHLLVTNDFPPKVGGIQSYLWELWRRLPPDDFAVLTSPYDGSEEFDRSQDFEIRRTPEPVLLPSPLMTRRIRRWTDEFGAEAVVLDPAVPLGLVGPHLGLPYASVLHGAEVTVPGRIPVTRTLIAQVLRQSSLLISAGRYPEAEAQRAVGGPLPPVVHVPPGVDVDRFVPLSPGDKLEMRGRLGLSPKGPLVVSVSRLVPRKGMDVLIEAAARLKRTASYPDFSVVIAGKGRDHARLERLVTRTGAPVRLIGRISDADLPGLYACADVFALLCRSRWGGLEQEGFGIVFLEAAAAGVPSVAGDSGGAAEAVSEGETGLVVADPTDPAAVAAALERLIADPGERDRQGLAARSRAVDSFSYDLLADRLKTALNGLAVGC